MTRLRDLTEPDHLPALDRGIVITRPGAGLGDDQPPARILLLYGSLRERSFSRLAAEEAARLLILFGAEVRIFDPSDLPLPDQVKGDDHPAVHELRQHALWSEGMVWCSPERHGHSIIGSHGINYQRNRRNFTINSRFLNINCFTSSWFFHLAICYFCYFKLCCDWFFYTN